MTDNERKNLANRLRIIKADNFENAAERIMKIADELDPPRKLDRSLHGWVTVHFEGDQCVYYAREDGLYFSNSLNSSFHPWDTVEDHGWYVEKLSMLEPGQVAVPRPFLQKVMNTVHVCGYPSQAARLKLLLDNCMEVE